MSVEYGCTKYLVEKKSYFRVKSFERKNDK